MTFNVVITSQSFLLPTVIQPITKLQLTKSFVCHQEPFFPTTPEEQHVAISFAYTLDNLSKPFYFFRWANSNADFLACSLDSEI